MKKSELRSLIREQVKTILKEADMTNRYDGFIVLNDKDRKTYKFKYIKGTSNVKVENEAIAKLMKATGLTRGFFGVHGFVQKGEWNNIKKDTIDEANDQKNSTSLFGGPAGLTKDQTLKVAQKFAAAMSKVEGAKVTVNKRTFEEDGFDLDYNGEEFDGGSYNIYKNGNVVNMAVRENPILGKVTDSVDVIAKNFKKMIFPNVNESVIKEANEMSFINKARAKSSLDQIKKGKRADGMGKFNAKVYAIKGTQEIELKTPEDLAKYATGYKYGLKEGVAITEAGEAAPYGSGYAEVNEDAGMVIDVAMGVAAGLMGLWALVQSSRLVGRVFGDSAEALANKFEKEAKLALKNHRKETIAPIIAKFKNDTKLADMYQALTPYSAAAKLGSSQAGLKAQQERVNQLTKIGNYIKSKLTPEEMKYFTDISSMLRDGDIKESVIKEEITLNSPSFKKLVIYLQKISDENGNDWKDLVTKLKSKYAMLDTYTSGTNEAAYVVNFFSITKGKDEYVKKKPSDYVEIGEWYVRPW